MVAFGLNFTDIQNNATAIDGDLLIQLDGDDRVLLQGVELADLDADDFIFV